jgi:hypothetical protein
MCLTASQTDRQGGLTIFAGQASVDISNTTGNDYGGGYSLDKTLGVYIEGSLSFSVDGSFYGPFFSDLPTDLPFRLAVASNNGRQYFELLRKTPVCWESRAPAWFVKKYADGLIMHRLKLGICCEVIMLI